MSRPRPHHSSLLVEPNIKAAPYKDWLALTTTSQEYDQLLDLFVGLPTAWIEWAEARTQRRIRDGLEIENPLSYRLNVLWNGIIALQEIKFICDVVENALRQATVDFIAAQQVTYAELLPTVPRREELTKSYEREQRRTIVQESIVDPSFVFCWDFYQLAETLSRNWKRIACEPSPKDGFRTFFAHVPKCRDAALFREDMKRLREMRNDVAHSRRLFQHEEAQEAYRRSCVWLDPLNVALRDRVLAYRRRRPNFLESLQLR